METEKAIENIKEAKLILLCNNIVELFFAVNEGQKQELFKNDYWKFENDEEIDLIKLKTIANEIVLKELEKKDKIIDEMAKVMIENDVCEHFIENHCVDYAGENKNTCDVCIKQYFKKKAEESE